MKNTISQEKIKSIFRRLKQLKKLFKEEKTYNLILEKIYYLRSFYMFELKWEKNIRGDFLCGNKNGIKKKSCEKK